jgi:hypothetical protein
LPITNGLNFSPVAEQIRAMVSLSLANLPALHFSPYSTKLRFGTPFQRSPISSTFQISLVS